MLALLLAPVALAWNHTGHLWTDDDLPLSWTMDDATEDSLPYTVEELHALLTEASDAWKVAECAALQETIEPYTAIEGPSADDNFHGVYWEDPTEQLAAGVLGLTITQYSLATVARNDRSYNPATDSDVIFANGVEWGTPDEIRGAGCSNLYDVLGVATHEFGHRWGMGHSCEDGEACNNQLYRDATMYWSVSKCNGAQSDLNQDDIDGITALYGPFGSMVIDGPVSGATPFAVNFAVASDYPVASVSWRFGDGESSTEPAPVHTYETAGQYTVSAEMELEDEACGTYTYNAVELGMVTACDEPAPEDGAAGFFTMEPVSGTTWQVINHADVSVYGCVDTIAWQIYKGSGEAAISAENLVDINGDDVGDTFGAWSPKIDFPAEGAYTIVMNVGGPGGLAASYLTVDVVQLAAEGEGCAAVPGTAGLLGLAGAAFAAATRRRRSVRA